MKSIIENKANIGLRKKMILVTMVLVIGTLMITMAVFLLILNTRFDAYVQGTQLDEVEKMAQQIKDELLINTDLEGATQALEALKLLVVAEGYYYEVLDQDGDLIYSTGNINGPGMMTSEISILKMQHMPMYTQLEIKSYIIEKDDNQYLINLGYVPVDGLSDEASKFISTIYITTGITLIIAIFFALILTNVFTKPIVLDVKQLQRMAKNIGSGRFTDQYEIHSNVEEITVLSEEMKHMAKILREQESLRRDLVETVSHEVKTPRTILKSQIEAISDGIYEADAASMKVLTDEIGRIEQLLARMDANNDLLANKYIVNRQLFSLDDELLAIRETLNPQFEKKDILLKIVGEEAGFIESDPFKLRQVLYNLLSNAYKFADVSTEVFIQVEKIKGTDSISVSIENRGLVIPEEEKDHIFESHYRTENAKKQDPYGKGLGLGIISNLMNVLGGQIILRESNALRTVFTITVPAKVGNQNL